jgi:hypothetical protein
MNAHCKIVSHDFGRESGDRGTSVFNYLTNMLLVHTLSNRIRKLTNKDVESFADWLEKIRGDKASVDFMAEGDDLLLFIAACLIPKTRVKGEHSSTETGFVSGKAELMSCIYDFYDDIQFTLEPAVAGGVADRNNLEEGLFHPYERMEWVSKIFVLEKQAPAGHWQLNLMHGPKGEHHIVAYPKLQKTMRSAQASFSSGDENSVAYSACTSGEYGCASCPLLRNYFNALRYYYGMKGGSWKPTDYNTLKLNWICEDYHINNVDELIQHSIRQYSGVYLTDNVVRTSIALEHPRLTISDQLEIEQALKSSLGKDLEETWRRIGDARQRLLSLM